MLAMAKSQCPDRNPEEIKRLAGHVHACAATGSDSGESYYSRDDERMTGDARAVDDSHYDVQPPSPIPNGRMRQKQKRARRRQQQHESTTTTSERILPSLIGDNQTSAGGGPI
jgi:hypothetical protein